MIARIPLWGVMDVNCYAWIDDETKHGFLIDPGAQGDALLQLCGTQGWIIESILLTHGHFDHFGGIPAIQAKIALPIYIHEAGEAYLLDPALNLSAHYPPRLSLQGAHFLRDGDLLPLSANPSCALQVIHTPGHTPDSVTFYDEMQNVAFVGDTIFAQGGRGNDRFPGGNGKTLLRSIRERILTLPNSTLLYPGHGQATSVMQEMSFYR